MWGQDRGGRMRAALRPAACVAGRVPADPAHAMGRCGSLQLHAIRCVNLAWLPVPELPWPLQIRKQTQGNVRTQVWDSRRPGGWGLPCGRWQSMQGAQVPSSLRYHPGHQRRCRQTHWLKAPAHTGGGQRAGGQHRLAAGRAWAHRRSCTGADYMPGESSGTMQNSGQLCLMRATPCVRHAVPHPNAAPHWRNDTPSAPLLPWPCKQ